MKNGHLGRDVRFGALLPCSIFLRQQNGSGGAVGLGDGPDFGAVRKVIGGQNPEAFLDRQLVLTFVFFIELAPIAGALGVELSSLHWHESTRAPKDYYFLAHFLLVNDLRIGLTQGCNAAGVDLVGFIPEYLGKSSRQHGLVKHIKDYVCDVTRPEENLNHTPDAVFALAKNASPALFFLEIDRGTEVVSNESKGVLKACRFYLSYLTSGRYQRYGQDFGCSSFKGFRTLIITTSESRVQNIRQAVNALPCSDKLKRFLWLATMTTVEHNPFQNTWHSSDIADLNQYRIG